MGAEGWALVIVWGALFNLANESHVKADIEAGADEGNPTTYICMCSKVLHPRTAGHAPHAHVPSTIRQQLALPWICVMLSRLCSGYLVRRVGAHQSYPMHDMFCHA